jgi:hypothetical protein
MIGTQRVHRGHAIKLMVAGCLLLGAGFLIKLDATGMIATNVLGGVSRTAAPVMQYGRTMVEPRRGQYGDWWDGRNAGGRGALGRVYGNRNGYGGPNTYRAGAVTGSPVPAVEVQGESLRTWSYEDPYIEQVQVDLSTVGRPLNATIEVWNGAGNTPIKARVYSEDGEIRPISALLETPRGPSTVAVRNTAQVTFPMNAQVDDQYVMQPSMEHQNIAEEIQGAALRTYPLEASVEAVEIILGTDGRPLNARIEILQGPHSIKQAIDLYSEDGLDRPFFCTLATPWSGNIVKITNTGPVEFPLTASIVPTFPRNR